MVSFPVSWVEPVPCPVRLGVVRRSFPRVCPSLVTGEYLVDSLFIQLVGWDDHVVIGTRVVGEVVVIERDGMLRVHLLAFICRLHLLCIYFCMLVSVFE